MKKSGLVAAAVVLLGWSGAWGDVITYRALLDGASEAPPNASPATGFALVSVDTVALTMRVRAQFSGLLGTSTVAHIHAATAAPFTGTAGVATTTPTFTGFPAGVTSGSYDFTFDMTAASSFNPSFVTNNGGTVGLARDALFAAMRDGKSYFNLHSSEFGGGEIRGFLTVVPLPGAGLMGVVGLCAVAGVRRRMG